MKFWSLFIALLVSGCIADAPKFNVRVCGDVRIPEDVDGYRVVVFDEDLAQELRSGAEELVTCPGDQVLDLPRSSSFESVVGNSWVRLQGLKDGIVVTTFDRRVRANEDDDVDITVGMTRACIGATCAKGLTCYDGVCQAAKFESNDSVCKGSDVPIVDDPEPTPFCPVEEGGTL
jgi:hypothetical protein